MSEVYLCSVFLFVPESYRILLTQLLYIKTIVWVKVSIKSSRNKFNSTRSNPRRPESIKDIIEIRTF